MSALIILDRISKAYTRGDAVVPILKDMSLRIAPGEFLSLIGPSGSGKTTLLNLIGGIDRPTGGEVRFRDVRLDQLSENALTRWRAEHVGFVFQFYNLLPTLTAAQNVEVPLLLTRLSRRERASRVEAALELVQLSHRGRHKPSEMSGGEQQRVAIARALVSDPDLLLCDEPTGDLDRETADAILDLLTTCARDLGKTVIMVTHDPIAAARAQRRVAIDKGVVLRDEVTS